MHARLPASSTILAFLCQHRERLEPFKPATPAAREPAALVERRRGEVDQRTALVNQLVSLLKRVYPQSLTLAGEHLVVSPACAFLRRFPSLAAAKKTGPNRLREFYRPHKVRSAARVEERVKLLLFARPTTTDEAILRRAAPKFLRQTLVVWAGRTVPRCAWAKEHDLKQKATGKGRHAILSSLAFKWVRILWRC